MVIIVPVMGVLLRGVGRLNGIIGFALAGGAASILPELHFTTPSPLVRVDPDFMLETRMNNMISNGVIITLAIFYAAHRMTWAESHGEAGRIQISAETRHALGER